MHHAYLYEGDTRELPTLLEDAKKRFGFDDTNSGPDVHAQSFETFRIEDARALTLQATLKHVSSRGLFVLAFATITTEAQQALLHLIEEPQEGSVFILLMPHGIALPTIRSRCQTYPLKQHTASIPVNDFLNASYKERSAYITALLKEEEGQKERVRAFLSSLQEALIPHMQSAQIRSNLQDLIAVQSYASDRSASFKMLLEHLAVSLPKQS